MRAVSRVKVARNMQYHQQMADHYSSQLAEAEGKEVVEGEATTATSESDNQYLADLHAEVAQQLRDVLGSGEPPTILGEEPPVSRRLN